MARRGKYAELELSASSAYWSGVLVDVRSSPKLLHKRPTKHMVHTRDLLGFSDTRFGTHEDLPAAARARVAKCMRVDTGHRSPRGDARPCTRSGLLVVGRRVGPLTPDEVDRAEVAPPQLDHSQPRRLDDPQDVAVPVAAPARHVPVEAALLPPRDDAPAAHPVLEQQDAPARLAAGEGSGWGWGCGSG